jgi:hypothetical protein
VVGSYGKSEAAAQMSAMGEKLTCGLLGKLAPEFLSGCGVQPEREPTPGVGYKRVAIEAHGYELIWTSIPR